MSVHAFVSLKQPDLHAISALASLKTAFGDAAPKNLFRCRHLVFTAAGDPVLSADFLAPLLATRFDIVNPNKEKIGWDSPPAVTLSEAYALFWIDVVSRHPDPAQKIRLADREVEMSARVTWGIVLPTGGLDHEALQSRVSDLFFIGKSGVSPLLVNPVLETAQFI